MFPPVNSGGLIEACPAPGEALSNVKTGQVPHRLPGGINLGFERNPGTGRAEQLGQQSGGRTGRWLGRAARRATKKRPDIAPVGDALDVQLDDRAQVRSRRSPRSIDQVHSVGALPARRSSELPAAQVGRIRRRYPPPLGASSSGRI